MCDTDKNGNMTKQEAMACAKKFRLDKCTLKESDFENRVKDGVDYMGFKNLVKAIHTAQKICREKSPAY